MKKSRMTIIRGLPASGKSSWAKAFMEQHQHYKRINRDSLRAMLDFGVYSPSKERQIRNAELALAELFLTSGYNLVIDDCNLSESAMSMWTNFAERLQVGYEVKDFTNVPLEVCIERDQKRPNYVGEQVIRRMHRQFLYKSPESPAYDPDLPDAWIVDIDGTLALMNGRNPYDASTCEQDLPNQPIIDLLAEHQRAAMSPGKYIHTILTSGREIKYAEQTIKWLDAHAIPFDNLLMRETGDNRRDFIVKRELYEQHIKGKYNVRLCLDDRSQIVQVWRSLGLTCLQVDDGDF